MRVARDCVRSVLALLVAVSGLWLVAPSAVAAEQTVDDIVYEYDASSPSSGATVIDYTGPGGAVTIPDRVTLAGTTYDVVGIGAESFRSKALTELTVPDSVTTIGNSAFRDNALTSLTIPDSITAIGEAAFQGNRIADLDLGTGLTTIGVDVFRNNALTRLTIPAHITAIGEQAFLGNQIADLDLGAGLATIGVRAFGGNALTELTIPDNVTTIGPSAFTDNPDLIEVRFLGAAPTVTAAGLGESFDTSSGALVLRYLPEYDATQVSGGFTQPQWMGYDTAFISAPVPPGITGSATTDFTVGVPNTWSPDTLTGDAPLTVTLTDGTLPTGLTLDQDTGTISGTAMATAGDYPIALTATHDATTTSDTHELTITVLPGAVTALALTASAATPVAGDTITLTATGTDAADNPLGNLTPEVTFSSDVATDQIDGNQVTFPTASPHVITAVHADTGVTASLTIDVASAADEPAPTPDESDDRPPIDRAPGNAGTLPDTGAPEILRPLAAALALLLGGGYLLSRARTRGKQSS